ncbi:MAG: hypothetical protein GXP55_12730 [Deltaproteobacteria bacterium]|nr:hypothetical protein [Deltaproteobacteria bacterium]
MKRGADAANIFSAWTRRALLLLLSVSAIAGLGALLYGARFVLPQAGPSDSYGRGPIGHRVFAQTLERLGVHVLQNRGDNFSRASAPLLFLEPGREARVEGRLRWLADAISARGDLGRPSVVVLPKWRFAGADGSVEEVAEKRVSEVVDSCFRMQGANLTLSRRGEDRPTRARLLGPLGDFEIDVPRLTTMPELPAGAQTLLQAEEGAVVIRAADGTIVVTDADLVHSFNFHRADHAALWLAILARLDADAIVIDESFHGHGRVLSLTDVLGQFPAVLLVAQFVLILILLFAFGSRRFGPPEEPKVGGHGPSEAIRVTASVLADGQNAAELTSHYVAAELDDLHQRLGLPDVRDRAARAAAVDAVAKVRHIPPRASELLLLSETLDHARRMRAQAWRVARDMHHFKLRLLWRAASGSQTSTQPRNDA